MGTSVSKYYRLQPFDYVRVKVWPRVKKEGDEVGGEGRNGGVGVLSHFKVYVFDDTLVMSG